ncbi:MAG: BolA family protein [Alphaproteobacteria bacterium]|jgi:BolA protein
MQAEALIKSKLEKNFSPTVLVLENESHKHAGHAGSPNTGNSHFKLTIAAPAFEGKSRIEAHKMVYACLEEELQSFIHALSVVIQK